jgi:hypothetical protein
LEPEESNEFVSFRGKSVNNARNIDKFVQAKVLKQKSNDTNFHQITQKPMKISSIIHANSSSDEKTKPENGNCTRSFANFLEGN